MKIKQQPQSLQSLLLVVDDKNSVLREISAKGSRNIVYTAYGDRPDVSTNSHLGYNGELREIECGWYMLGNGYRAFNPRLMRFHSPDSLSPFREGGLNAYAYCLGNPIKWKDESGHMVNPARLVSKVKSPRRIILEKLTADNTSANANIGLSSSSKIGPPVPPKPKPKPIHRGLENWVSEWVEASSPAFGGPVVRKVHFNELVETLGYSDTPSEVKLKPAMQGKPSPLTPTTVGVGIRQNK